MIKIVKLEQYQQNSRKYKCFNKWCIVGKLHKTKMERKIKVDIGKSTGVY